MLVSPYVDTIAYCLMPNHFHFLVSTNQQSVQPVRVGSLTLSTLSNGFKILLSSYATAVNRQNGTSGSLFRQNTKAKLLENGSENYAHIAFHYIHQNPLKAGLVESLDDWDYSSYKDYTGLRNGTLCNQSLARQLIDMNWDNVASEANAFFNQKTDYAIIF